MNRSLALAAALLPAFAAPAMAAGTFALQGSATTMSVVAWVGTAIVDAPLPCDYGDREDSELCNMTGSLALNTTSASPGVTSISGQGSSSAATSLWTAWMDFEWSTQQSFAVTSQGADTVLSASGLHESTYLNYGVGGPGALPTKLTTVSHFQSIAFTLDATTDFTMSGLVFGEYMPIQLYRADAEDVMQLIGSWCPYEGEACSGSGTLAPGRYMTRVFEFANTDSNDHYRFGWDYSFTFHDTVSAVPEPGSVAMLALGLAVVGAFKRRQDTRA